MKPIKLYKVIVYSTKNTVDGLREVSHDCIFQSKSPRQAVVDGLRFAKEHTIQVGSFYDFLFVGSIEILHYWVGPVDEKGVCSTCHQGKIFDWKYDWHEARGMISSESEQLLDEVAALRTEDWRNHAPTT